MKKIALMLAGAAMLAGSTVAIPQTASAVDVYITAGHRVHHHRRHRHRVCRIEHVRKVVWRHHHRHVVRYKVRRCHWV